MLVERKSLFSDTNVTKLISRLKFTKKSLMTAFTTNSGQVQYSRKMSYKLRTIFFLKRSSRARLHVLMSYTCACPTYRISNDYTLALTLVLLEQGAGLGPLALVPRVFLPLRIPQATQLSSQFYPAVTKKK